VCVCVCAKIRHRFTCYTRRFYLLIAAQRVLENVWCLTESPETLICSLNSSTTILFEETLCIFLSGLRMHGRWDFFWVRTSFLYSMLSVSQCTKKMVKYTIHFVYKPRHSRRCSRISCLERMFFSSIQTWILIWKYHLNLSAAEPVTIFCTLPLFLYRFWWNFKYHEGWNRSLKINRALKVSRSIRKVCWNSIN
jgi:hypothetical protein